MNFKGLKRSLASKGNNQESQKPKEQQNLEMQKDNHKLKITITGDSIVKNLHVWMMSRNKSVKVSCFPRATTQDMVSYLKPLINRKPDHLLIHIGANNLSMDSPQEIVENIAALAKLVTDEGTDCSVSEILRRDDYLSLVGQEVNCILRNILPDNVKLVSDDSISNQHLNRSGIHLNERGMGALAYNCIQFIKKLDFKRMCV